MNETITINVIGEPAPQGSKRHVGKGILVESSKKVKPWREAVKWAVIDAGSPRVEGAVHVELTFFLARPKSHYGTGRNAGAVKISAPTYPAVRPDIDKLARSTLDGLGDAGVFEDDSRIVSLRLMKMHTEGAPCCFIKVQSI